MNNENLNQRFLLARLDMLVADYQQVSSRISELNRQQTDMIRYQTSIRQAINNIFLNEIPRTQNSRTTSIPIFATTSQTNPLNNFNGSSIRSPTFNFAEIFADFMDPIPIIPTQEEINNATTIRVFSDIENPINTTCPIRSEEFVSTDEVIQINYCGHIFSKTDLLQWFQRNHRCPICRFDIRNNSSPNVDLQSLFQRI